MNIQVLNTKAEQAMLQMFDTYMKRFPGGPTVSSLRRSAIGVFASKGFPSRRQEEWKYTDLKAAFNEFYPSAIFNMSSKKSPVEKETSSLPSFFIEKFNQNLVLFWGGQGDLSSSSLHETHLHKVIFFSQFSGDPPTWICRLLEDPALSNSAEYLLNTALFTDGVVIDIPPETTSLQPYCIFSGARTSDSKSFSALRHFIRVGSKAKVDILEFDNTGQMQPHQSSHLTQIEIGNGADVTHVKIVLSSSRSTHLGHWQVSLGSDATYKPLHVMLGDGLIRSSLNVNFKGESSSMDYGGVSLVKGNGHIDNTLVIDHEVPRCTSRELFKAVLEGESKSVFQGKVIVRPDAQKTDGKQMAQALMLSPTAEFDSKPELEIYADDVACGHGSTCAEIDPDLLFYCRSRGISLEAARSLLIDSFVGEVLDKIDNSELKSFAYELTQVSPQQSFNC